MATIGDIYRLTVQMSEGNTGTGQINVFHFRAAAVTASAASLIADWRGNVESEYRATMSTDIFFREYRCTNLIPFQTEFSSQTTTLQGLDSPIALPMNTCAIITWRTGLPGRRRRGRTYISGIYRVEHVGGVLVNSYLTTRMQPFGNKVLARFGPSGTSPEFRIGVWSRVNGHQVPPHDAAGFTPITAFTAQPNMGSMCTRRVGRGL